MFGIGGIMMKQNISECIDINSKYCPCLLAQTNQCLVCSHLKGEVTCDCHWTGTCILYEQHWQNNLHHGKDLSTRSEEQVELMIKEKIGHNTYRLEFQVTAELAEGLKKIGSFVFLRSAKDPQFFNFPINVMTVEKNTVKVVIEAIGPKSIRLLEENNNVAVVRGPYYNGVLGEPWIDNLTYGKIVLVAGGIGQAPAFPLAVKLIEHHNEVMALLAPGKVGEIFIEQPLKELGVMVYPVTSLRRVGMSMLREWFSLKPDVIVSAGPDEQHYGIIAAMQQAGLNIPMVATNNATMCCGEGICGSCLKTTQEQKTIRMCKQQTNFSNIIED